MINQFKITCMSCGKETILTQGKVKIRENLELDNIESNNEDIYVQVKGMYEIEGKCIQCDCGNVVED